MANAYRWLKSHWLHFSRGWIFTWFIGPGIATGLVTLVYRLLGIRPRSGAAEVLATAIIFAITLMIVQFVRYTSMHTWVTVLRDIDRLARDIQRPFLEELATQQITAVRDTIEQLVTGGYEAAVPETLSNSFQSFFEHGGPEYSGIDSHLPSEFIDQYEWYLRVHQAHLGQLSSMSQRRPSHIRILAATRNELTNDYLQHTNEYQEFIRWHKANGVALRWVDRDVVSRARKAYAVPEGTDICLWTNFAVSFSEGSAGALKLQMHFPHDRRGTQLSMDACSQFVSYVKEKSAALQDGPPGLEVVEQDLALAWEAYVDSRARMSDDGQFGKFILGLVGTPQLHILDAAGGIGCESILLLKAGHSVVTNEVDANLARVASEFAAERGMKMDLRRYLWEQLSRSMPGNMKFDVVLCLGNSLCLVEDPDGRSTCIHEFRDVLKTTGRLIIDERNFDYMLSHSSEILRDPLSFPPVKKDVMYAGDTVRGVPVSIEQDLVEWRLFRTPKASDASSPELEYCGKQPLRLYPFKRGELVKLLESSNFRVRRAFADLRDESLTDGKFGPEVYERAHFFTYEAVRAP